MYTSIYIQNEEPSVWGNHCRSNTSYYHTHVLSLCIATLRSIPSCSHWQTLAFAFKFLSYLHSLHARRLRKNTLSPRWTMASITSDLPAPSPALQATQAHTVSIRFKPNLKLSMMTHSLIKSDPLLPSFSSFDLLAYHLTSVPFRQFM